MGRACVDRVCAGRGAGARPYDLVMEEVSDRGTRQRTLDAAARLLRDEGPQALAVRRIAAEAGVSTIAIYHHFGGKDGLVEALYVDGFRALDEALAAVPRTEDPLADVEALALAYRSVAIARPGYYEVMFSRPFPGFTPSPDARRHAMRPWRVFTERLERCEEAGLLNVSAADAALLIWASGHGLLMLQLAGNALASADTDRLVREGVRSLLAAVAVSR